MSDRSGLPKSREVERFGLYLRYGVVTTEDDGEFKFNPYHDPDDGRFTFAPGGGTLPSREQRANMGTMPGSGSARPSAKPKVPSPTPRRASTQPAQRSRRVDHSWLATQTETSGNRNPGFISSGKGDAGGQSYGPHQLASKTGTVSEFVASPEARHWAREFNGLKPETAGFNQRWKQVAVRDYAAFLAAQDAYTNRIFYGEPSRKIANATGLNIETRSEAVRQVVYATSINQGQYGAPSMIAGAIRTADKTDSRISKTYDRSLINAIYDIRTTFWLNKSNRELAKATTSHTSGQKSYWTSRARTSKNVAMNNIPAERARALRLLQGMR